MEIITSLIATAVPVIFTNNVLMSGVKYLAGHAATKVWLRAVLTFLSFFGVIASAALTGDSVNFGYTTELLTTGFTTVVVAIASHFSYKVIKNG